MAFEEITARACYVEEAGTTLIPIGGIWRVDARTPANSGNLVTPSIVDCALIHVNALSMLQVGSRSGWAWLTNTEVTFRTINTRYAFVVVDVGTFAFPTRSTRCSPFVYNIWVRTQSTFHPKIRK